MEVLAWRGSYGSAIDWFIATNYGTCQYTFRKRNGKLSIETIFTSWPFGSLDQKGLTELRSNIHLTKMCRRVTQAGGIVSMVEAPSIEALNETWNLSTLVKSDTKAHNAWCNLTGFPVGTSFEDVVVKAEAIVMEKRETELQFRAKVMMEVDDRWGIF